MRVVIGLYLAAVLNAFGQSPPLSPTAEFELNARGERPDRRARSYFAATPGGLTLVTIGESRISLTTADLGGRILSSRSDLASVNSQIYTAIPRPDGCIWLASSPLYKMFNGLRTADAGASAGHGIPPTPAHDDLDLYSPAGEHLMSVRVLAPEVGTQSPIAAAGDQLVLRSSGGFASPRSQFIHFGTVTGGRFQEQVRVPVSPPVTGVIPLLASNGNLLLVGRTSGSMMVVDQKAKSGWTVRFDKPGRIRAAAADADRLYLLSAGVVSTTDLAGHTLATYRFQCGRRFEPLSLGVTGKLLYLVDSAGRAERFQLD